METLLATAAEYGIAIIVLVLWGLSAERRCQKEKETSDKRADSMADMMVKQVESNAGVEHALSTLSGQVSTLTTQIGMLSR